MLDYRTLQADRAQQRVAEQQQRCQSIIEEMHNIDAGIAQALQEQRHLLTSADRGATTFFNARTFSDFLSRRKISRRSAEQRLAEERRRLAIVQEDLRQAVVRQKSLELLKDKDYTQYLKTLDKLEDAFLSEIALQRAIRTVQP